MHATGFGCAVVVGFGREERTQRDPFERPGRLLQLCEPALGRPDQPARVGVEGLDRRARVVQRADVPVLDDGAVGSIGEPAQRHALGSAHLRAGVIHTARAIGSKHRTRAHTTGGLGLQHVGVLAPNAIRLDSEHGQVVDAAIGAATTAVQPRAVYGFELGHACVDGGMEGFEGRGGERQETLRATAPPIRGWTFGMRPL